MSTAGNNLVISLPLGTCGTLIEVGVLFILCQRADVIRGFSFAVLVGISLVANEPFYSL